MLTDNITGKLTAAEQLMREVGAGTNGIKNIVVSVSEGTQVKIDKMLVNIDKVQDKVEEISKKMTKASHKESEKIQDKLGTTSKNLAELERRLGELGNVIEDKVVLEEMLQNISQLTYNIQASLEHTIDLLDSDLIAKLKEQINSVSGFVGDVTVLLDNVRNELDYLRDFGTRLQDKS